jgi:hypothetical protein
MKVLDFIAGIPYRIIGVLLILVSIIIGIPVVVIPTIISLIINGRTIDEAVFIGQSMMENGVNNIEELLYIFDNNHNVFAKITGKIFSMFVKGLCMILAGIYFDEVYNELITLKID